MTDHPESRSGRSVFACHHHQLDTERVWRKPGSSAITAYPGSTLQPRSSPAQSLSL